MAVPLDFGLDELLDVAEQSPRSRSSVYEPPLDNVVGIVHVKDVLEAARRDASEFDIRAIVRTASLVPETMSAGRLLSEFRRAHTTMAVVIDEYSGTAGVVTIDDIIDEIVGDVPDEFHEQTPDVVAHPGRHVSDRANAAPGRVRQALRRATRRRPGGRDDRPPRQTGDEIEVEGHRLTVEAVEGVRITKLRLRPGPSRKNGERADEDAEVAH